MTDKDPDATAYAEARRPTKPCGFEFFVRQELHHLSKFVTLTSLLIGRKKITSSNSGSLFEIGTLSSPSVTETSLLFQYALSLLGLTFKVSL